MGIFKRPDDFVFSVDRTWDMDLINHIYTDQGLFSKTVESAKGCFNLPDRHHLNSNGSLYLLDLIFYKIEELEGENNVNKSNNLE